MRWRTEVLEPFGLCVVAEPSTRPGDIPAAQLHAWIAEHRVVVLRGAAPTLRRDLPAVARRLGPLLAWSFGAINELEVDHSKHNYLFTPSAVPLHWDGAFIGTIPRYLFFQCVVAPPTDGGGQTLFCDTRRALEGLSAEERAAWALQVVRYEAEKVVHYGGCFEQRVIDVHPGDRGPVIRYAEPVRDLNPVSLTFPGLADAEAAALQARLVDVLYDPGCLLAHTWQDGDYVWADNHVLLHGRRAFDVQGARHLQRINILDAQRAPWQWVWDSLRIRRPEFMVAEVPILLIATLLVAPSSAVFASGAFWEGVVVFFALFHFGDMINCLADRDLDAVYKTRLSEAVYGLGVANVTAQLVATAAVALLVAAHLGWGLERPWLPAVVALGVVWGAQYSVGPLHLKGRGLWQVVTLVGILFVGPMVWMAGVVSGWPPLAALWVFTLYGVMQQGTILVNTAEDHTEDLDTGIHTSAVALGPRNTVQLSWCMVAVGGGGLLGWFGASATTLGVAYALGLFSAAWLWVLLDIGALWWMLRDADQDTADGLLKAWARRMPLWITALAWTVLFTVWLGFPWN